MSEFTYKNSNIKVLEEYTGMNLYDSGLGNIFSDMNLKEQITEELVDKLDFIKIKICTSEDTMKKKTGQPMKWVDNTQK